MDPQRGRRVSFYCARFGPGRATASAGSAPPRSPSAPRSSPTLGPAITRAPATRTLMQTSISSGVATCARRWAASPSRA
eukprot:7596467-Lingulodinium_polyedra.AAC.1